MVLRPLMFHLSDIRSILSDNVAIQIVFNFCVLANVGSEGGKEAREQVAFAYKTHVWMHYSLQLVLV